MSAVWDREEMIRKAENLVRTAAEKGAQVVLLQELFETPYFCQRQDIKYGIHFTAGSEWGSAGISGSPKRPGPWP